MNSRIVQLIAAVAVAASATAYAQTTTDLPPADQPSSVTPEAPPPPVTPPPPATTTDVTPPAPTYTAPPPEPVVPPPVAYQEPERRHHNRVFAPGEVALTTGAGAGNYFGTSTGTDTIDPGAAWDARVTFGTRSVIALEAGYMGGVNNLELAGTNHGQLHSNGVDGDLRLQLPTRVQPYVFGGVGYNHMEVANTGGQGIFVGKDDQVTIPAGAGLDYYVGRHLNLDARGTYRFIPDNGITEMGTGHLHQWIAQANIGYVF